MSAFISTLLLAPTSGSKKNFWLQAVDAPVGLLDSFDEFFDGDTRSFQLQLNNEPVTIRAANGSPIDVDAVLLIFINDILQVPGDAYTFDGGTMVNFTEPPKGQVPGFANSGD